MTYAELDRTIFETIRLAVVAAGYLPDNTVYNTDSSYATKKAAIKTAKGTVIEIFGVGSWQNHKEITDCKIIIERKNIEEGSLGGFGAVRYVRNGNLNTSSYTKIRQPNSSKHVQYDIRIITDKTVYERLMLTTLDTLFEDKKTIHTFDESFVAKTDEWITLKQLGTVDTSVSNYREQLFSLACLDIWFNEEILKSNVAALTTLTFNLYATKRTQPLTTPTSQLVGSGTVGATPISTNAFNFSFNNSFS